MARPFFWIDAFTDQPFAGNACAVILDAEGLGSDQMQRIAREIGLSETAFVVPTSRADFGARYFTLTSEIPLAGHPTLATVRALIEAGRIAPGRERLRLELPAGVVEVTITPSPLRITMTQLPPQFLSQHDPVRIAALFGLSPEDLVAGAPIQTVSTGTPQLMVPLRSVNALRRARLDAEAYTAYQAASDFFSPHLFVLEGATPRGQTYARHLGVPPEPVEDPFTGSATGGMAAYLWSHGLIQEPHFVAEQGHDLGRPGTADVEVLGPRDAIRGVRVGGGTAVLLRGEWL